MPHSLASKWTFWYIDERSINYSKAAEYSDNIKQLATISTLEDFCTFYQYVKRPTHLPGVTFCAFHEGVHPTWEDPAHINSGRIVVRFKKGYANHAWEMILFNLIGSQSPMLESFATGVTLSGAANRDTFKIWVDNKASPEQIDEMKQEIVNVWSIDDSCVEYYSFK